MIFQKVYGSISTLLTLLTVMKERGHAFFKLGGAVYFCAVLLKARFANGINLSPDGRFVLVASTADGTIQVHDREGIARCFLSGLLTSMKR